MKKTLVLMKWAVLLMLFLSTVPSPLKQSRLHKDGANAPVTLLHHTASYIGLGKDSWQFTIALPRSRGHVMSFSKNAFICVTG